MAEEIKKIYARIGGMSYHLVTSENELYTRQIAAKADEMINRVMQNNPHLSQNMATILALVNAVDELNGLYAKQTTVDNQKMEMEKQTSDIRKELMRLREQNWEMKKEILRLNDLCQDYQALITKLTTPGESTRTDILDDARLASQAVAGSPAATSAHSAPTAIAQPKPTELTFDGSDDEDLNANQYVTGDAQVIKPESDVLDSSDDSADDPSAEPDDRLDGQSGHESPGDSDKHTPGDSDPVSSNDSVKVTMGKSAMDAPAKDPAATPHDEAVDAAGVDADYEADDDNEPPPDLGKLLAAANAAKTQHTAPSRPTIDKQAAPQTIDEIMGRTSGRSSQQVGELKQTNLDDYLRATGWPQTYETKKNDT